MINPQLIDDLTRSLQALLPADAQKLKDDFEHNARALLRATLERMDLVSREELDRQVQMLDLYREKLAAVEQRLAQLESAAAANASKPDPD